MDSAQFRRRQKTLRDEAVRCIADLDVAIDGLIRELQGLKRANRTKTRRLARGDGASEVTRALRVGTRHANLNAALVRVQQSRHRAQRALFLMAEHEGESLAEVARTWGISRQLVSRMVGESPRRPARRR